MTDPALRTDGLTKTYTTEDGASPALAPLSLTVARGERVALVGHNGSGKTTLLRMVAGLLDPTAGTVFVLGHPRGSTAARAALSYLPDQPTFYDDLSLSEHLEYVARLHGVTDFGARADELLAELGLVDRREALPATFSRGLKQKTSIALAFVRPFELLLVDEPFVGLDATGRSALMRLLDRASAAGAAIVVATHELSFVSAVGRVVALADGELRYDGAPTNVDVDAIVRNT